MSENIVSQKLFKKVIYFEWVMLGVCFVGSSIAWAFAKPDPTAPSLLLSFVFLFLVGLLSFFAPVRTAYWDRICFLLLELILLTGACASGLARFVFPLYTVVIAKACLMLDRRGILAIGIVSFLAQIAWASFKLVILEPRLLAAGWTVKAVITLVVGSIIHTYAAIALMVLVGILALSLVAEQNSRLKAEKLSEEVESLARELERSRIAREIHDTLGHSLTAMSIQLDVAKKYAQIDKTKAEEALDTAKELAGQTLSDVRLAIQSIRTSDFQLKDAIPELIDRINQSKTVTIECDMEFPVLPSPTSYQLYRIVQECLTNVLKHAEASLVKVKMESTDNKHITLTISDNGCGLKPDAEKSGFGIQGIKERVEAMNGKVDLASKPDEGTTITVEIPL